MTKRWKLGSRGDDRPGVAAPATSNSAAANLPPLMQRVLAARGWHDPEAIQRFCEPKLAHLHETELLPNIDVAALRIIDAIRRDEAIVIYGDYDVDGITASAILFHTIKTIQPRARLRTYVPHRLEEGYGLNCDALGQLKSEGAQLIITVDCGITAVQSAAFAKEIGLDLIITDHHEFRSGEKVKTCGVEEVKSSDVSPLHTPCSESLPSACALVHPKLPGSAYPFTELCGAGVAFKLAWHLAKRWCNSDRVSEALQKTLLNMLPLVALGTIADVVPLVGENRVLTAFGLRLIKQTPLTGLRALIEVSDLMGEKIDCERVGFVLAPRLNACGRMGHASQAVHLLTEASAEEARSIANTLNEHNTHRQTVERRIFDQAARMAEDQNMIGDDPRAIVLADESWHPGVVGIVCSRMVERFSRPAVLLNRGRDICKGSARSIDGYSIHAGIAAGAEFLTTFGGHEMAAGLALLPENLDRFAAALIAHANQHITIDQLTPALAIDCEASLHELDLDAVHSLHALSPFGRGNRTPVLLVRGATLAEPPKQMGANGKHLALRVRQTGDAGAGNVSHFMRAVWWSAGERAADLASGMRIDLAIEPKLNEWNGRVSVEAHVRDLRISTPDRSDIHIQPTESLAGQR